MRKIRVLVDIYDGDYHIYSPDDILIEDEPYSGFDPDGSFTVCYGHGCYVNIPIGSFEEIHEDTCQNV